MLGRFKRLRFIHQSKIGYDCLIQNVILKELIIIKRTTITEIDIELNMKKK